MDIRDCWMGGCIRESRGGREVEEKGKLDNEKREREREGKRVR